MGVAAALGVGGCGVRDVSLVPETGEVGGAFDQGPHDSLAQCAVESVERQPVPLGIYMMVDQSTSMAGARWDSVVSALVSFIRSPDSAGISVGVQYFALNADMPDLLGFNTECDPAAYSWPDERILPLPENADRLIDSLDQHGPSIISEFFGSTAEFLRESPTDSALEGGVRHARSWQEAQENPGTVAAVLLVTDGVPGAEFTQNCSPTLEETVNVARAGVSGAPSVRTFVLGVGSSLTNLNQIAEAGGTEHAYLAAETDAQEIQGALDAIRDTALPCAFPLPETEAEFLPGEVNIQLLSPGFGEVLYNVRSVDGCPAMGGWYYDDTVAPSTITLCEQTCREARARPDARFDVVFGCATQTR